MGTKGGAEKKGQGRVAADLDSSCMFLKVKGRAGMRGGVLVNGGTSWGPA